MTYRDNIKAIIETNFIGLSEEYIEGVCAKICEIQPTEKTYEDGLNDAWEVARKLVHPVNGGYTDAEKKIIFDNLTSDSILLNFTASEAIAKIKEYEEIKEYEDKCKECKWDEFRDAQSPVGTPCDSCFEGKNFSPKVARCCSILNDTCPYDIPCAECEVHCSIERAKQKLKGDKE